MQTDEKLDELRMSWRPTQEKVDWVVGMAIEIARPSRVFIFGSWARGETATARDLDLAVLVPDERSDEIGELRRRLDEFSDWLSENMVEEQAGIRVNLLIGYYTDPVED